ncbi:MAG: hypothetical protein Q8L54_08145 [Devosia sp.]|nr:hypothetical protein [Devosia sp.]
MFLAFTAFGGALADPDSAPVPKPRIYRADDPTYSYFGPFLLIANDPSIIVLNGPILDDAPLEFRRALRKRPDAQVLVLISDGGYVDEALLIAHEVRDQGLNTYVPEGSNCFSACAYVYFAGAERRADGRLGVHQLWNQENDLVSGQSTFSDVFEAMRDFGVADDVISLMLRTPPGEMHVFSGIEVATLGINDGDPFTLRTEFQPTAENGKSEERVGITPSGELADSAEAAVAAIDPANIAGSRSLLLEASDEGTTGAVPFSGTVDWSKGTDETGLPTLIGKASIPARNLGVDVLIRKNSDPSLPASHLMEINFRVSDSFIGGSVAGLPGVLLKNEELVQGAPLVGASARVVGNSFLFALSASPEDMTANNTLLTSRKWMDLALIYATGKRAIITLEKDAEAEAMFSEVFDAWGTVSLIPADPDERAPLLDALRALAESKRLEHTVLPPLDLTSGEQVPVF